MADATPPLARALRALVVIGTLLTVLGIIVTAGWLLRNPALVRLAPGYAPMVFNTALSFVLLGVALAIPQPVAWRGRGQSLLGVAVAALATLVLAQDMFSVELGVDRVFGADWLNDPRPHPTRMAPTTAIAFVLAGMALVLTRSRRGGPLPYFIELMVYSIGLIGTLALCAYLFGIDFLRGWYPYQRMALHTAMGLMLLSFGLWVNLRRSRQFREQIAAKEDLRILHTGGAVLAITAIVTGIVSFVAFERQLETTLRRGLELLLQNRVDTFHTAIEQGAHITNAIATRPAIRREMARLRATPDRADALAFLDQAVKSFLPLGFSAIALYDPRGRALAQVGRFATEPSFHVDLPDPPGTEILWANGLILRVRLPISDNGQRLGTVVAERRLTQVERLIEDIRGLGETGEMAVCTARGDRIAYLPTRLKPETFVIEKRMRGQLLPMGHALAGESGVIATLDYRDELVIAAYSPIPRTGLGLVVKMDADEFYQPIRGQLWYGLPLVIGLITGGLMLLWYQIHPLARRLVQSQEEIRALSLTDELTGLRNRRGFLTLAEPELALARRMQRPMLLFYADLDGLKSINDTLGHTEGDRALRDTAAVLRRTFRDADILARLGGDEFAALVFGNDEGSSDAIARRLQTNIEELNRTTDRRYHLAMSVGTVRCEPSSRVPLDELLAQADTEMYRIKQERRAARKN